MGPGGKGSNQAVAAKRAGGNVGMITKLGKDQFGDLAKDSFIKEGIEATYVYQQDSFPTGTAQIMVDENTSENMIVVTPGACDHITVEEIEKARGFIKGANILVTQLETNMEAIRTAIDIAYESGILTILNPAPVQSIPDELYEKINILTPNEVEAGILTGVEIYGLDDAVKAARVFRNKGVEKVVITLGKKGVLVSSDEAERFIPSFSVKAVDTTGAGDAFNGGLSVGLAEGKDIYEAARFGNAVGALSVTKFGTAPAMPYRKEINALIGQKN